MLLSIPGPELVMQPMTALNAVSKSNPNNAKRKVKIIMLKKYAERNTNTEDTILLSLVKVPILTGTTRFGSTAEIKCFLTKANTTCQRKILIEPVVEPVHPPVKAKTRKMTLLKLPQSK